MHEERLFEDIGVCYEPKIVRITTDGALMRYLAQPGRGSQELSAHILARYEALLGQALEISEASMATEILIHAYLDALFLHQKELSQHLPGGLGRKLLSLAGRLQAHTTVIDVGERSVDTNRHIFDALSPYYGVLCAILGKKA